MDTGFLLIILALGTLCALLVFAFASKRGVEKKREDPNSTKSTLAEDAPNHRPD